MLVDSKMLPFYVCLFVNSLDSTSSFCGNGRKIASQTTECQTGKPIALFMIKKLLYTYTYFFYLFDHGQIHPICTMYNYNYNYKISKPIEKISRFAITQLHAMAIQVA